MYYKASCSLASPSETVKRGPAKLNFKLELQARASGLSHLALDAKFGPGRLATCAHSPGRHDRTLPTNPGSFKHRRAPRLFIWLCSAVPSLSLLE